MSYKKGKDIKQHGNCLVHCYKYRIEYIMKGNIGNLEHKGKLYCTEDKPQDFEKW